MRAVAELEGVDLDVAVAMAEGRAEIRVVAAATTEPASRYWIGEGGAGPECHTGGEWFAPSSVWSHGGPIIERERIELAYTESPQARRVGDLRQKPPEFWGAVVGGSLVGTGQTALIAAMRAFVVSKLGREIKL